jgi:hypothetical protein
VYHGKFDVPQAERLLWRAGSRHIAGLGVCARGELSLKLARGRYLLWCSVANHRKLGMRATLVVR